MEPQHSPAESGPGLHTAWLKCQCLPDPVELEAITGRNRHELRLLAKLLMALVDAEPGASFFAGSIQLAELLRCSHVAIRKRLKRLEELGVIKQTWEGGLCRRDPDGNDYADDGSLVRRASEFVFLGLSTLRNKV